MTRQASSPSDDRHHTARDDVARRRRSRVLMFAVLLAAPLLGSACIGVRSDLADEGTAALVPREETSESGTPTFDSGSTTSEPESTVSVARTATARPTETPVMKANAPDVSAARAAADDFAADMGVAPEDVTVTSVEAMQWNDSGLGCSQPDMLYLQVITPGYRVVVEIDGRQAVYHTDSGRPPNVVRCDPDVGSVAP